MPDRPSVPPAASLARPAGGEPLPAPSAAGADAPKSARVLLCDHRGAGTARLHSLLAAQGHQVVVSTTLRRTLELLGQSAPDLVVLDPLTGATGAEVEVVDRARRGELDNALLLVVEDAAPLPPGLPGPRPAERGVWDVVRRRAADDEIALLIDFVLRQLEQQVEMRRLRHVATHDDRTNLLRPQVFEAQLRQHFSASQRHNLSLALLLIDLDNFGRVNKVFDHTVGDAIISRVGAAIRRALRAEDVAARMGGDEFCVLLPYTRKVDASEVVKRLLDQIRAVSEEMQKGPDLRVSASIGFETFNGGDLESAEQLRLHAEEAERAAKRAGGDRGVYYRSLDSAMREMAGE